MNLLASKTQYWTNKGTNTRATFLRSRSRYLHTSATISWVPDPRTLIDKVQRPPVPVVQKGTTYNVGRNKLKASRRWVRGVRK